MHERACEVVTIVIFRYKRNSEIPEEAMCRIIYMRENVYDESPVLIQSIFYW